MLFLRMKSVIVTWQSECFALLPQKAIFWQKESTLFLSDPHFGKAATFQRAGIPISEKVSLGDCQRLGFLVRKTNAERIIFLGDFLHARLGRTESVRLMLSNWRKTFPELDLHLIRGNHDLKSGDPWPELGIQCHDEPWSMKTWDCRHHPIEEPGRPYLAGHLHPGFSIREKNRTSLKSACFHMGEKKLILPAFGSFTGLTETKPHHDDLIFLTNGEEIVALPPFRKS